MKPVMVTAVMLVIVFSTEGLPANLGMNVIWAVYFHPRTLSMNKTFDSHRLNLLMKLLNGFKNVLRRGFKNIFYRPLEDSHLLTLAN